MTVGGNREMGHRPLHRVLHVEDEEDIRTVTKLALEGVGSFIVESCESGAAAVEKAGGFKPDIIVIDVMMPEMDGPATLRALRKLPETADTAVVFMTAKAQIHEIEKFKSLGVAGIIVKPFDPMTLSERILEIWESRHG
jgi:CheY-like chemotaxis protein